MSIISCLFLFLLCLSLHACNPRPLPATHNKNLDKEFRISNQNDETKISVAENVKSSTAGKPDEVTKKDGITETDHHQLQDSKAKEKLIMGEERAARKSSSDAVQKGSLVSVPWRVPHNKRGEKHPGFNLDYSPPKTHPPSHN